MYFERRGDGVRADAADEDLSASPRAESLYANDATECHRAHARAQPESCKLRVQPPLHNMGKLRHEQTLAPQVVRHLTTTAHIQ